MKKKLLLLATLVFALSLFVACGSSDDSSSSPEPIDCEHTYTYDLSAATAPTEDADGELLGVCSKCGDQKTVAVPKLTNTLVWTVTSETDATCAAAGSRVYSSLYGSVTVDIPADASKHVLADVAAEDATCVASGVIAHKHCSVCEKNFDENGTELTDEDIVIPADDSKHVLIDVPASAATCKDYAVIAHKKCTVCGKLFVNGEEISSTDVIGVDLGAHAYDAYGECTVCGVAKFANTSYSLAQTTYAAGATVAEKLATLVNGVADDGIINPNGTKSPCWYTSCSAEITNSKLTFAFSDKEKGLIKVTSSYHYSETHDVYECDKNDVSEDRTAEYVAYYDAASNIIVVPEYSSTGADYAKLYIFVPSENAVDASCFTSLYWHDLGIGARPISYINGDVSFNLFADNVAKTVNMGVAFEDLSGSALTAGDIIADVDAFRIFKNGTLIASYGKNDSGKLVKLDGLEGTYSNIADPDEQITCTAIIDGKGNIIYGESWISSDDDYKGAARGTYTVMGGTQNQLAVYLNYEGAETLTKYYEITLNVSEKTAVAVMPKATITVTDNLGVGNTAILGTNKNIAFTIPEYSEMNIPETMGMAHPGSASSEIMTFCLVGLKASDGTMYKPGDAVVLTEDIALTATYKASILLTVKDETDIRSDVTVTVLEDYSILTALQEQFGLTYDAGDKTYKVKRWFAKAGDSEVDITETVLASIYDHRATVYVEWLTHIEIAVTDARVGNSTVKIGIDQSISEGLGTHDDYVDGYKFEGWYTDEACENKLSENAVATENGITALYAKYTWGGDVSFELGSDYTFVYDEAIGAFKSNNKGKGSSTALMEIAAVSGTSQISFDYFCSSETNWDKLGIYYSNAEGAKQSQIVISGNTDAGIGGIDSWGWIHLTAYLDPSFSYNAVRITYSKDSGGDKGLDTAYIKNLTINGRVITNAAPIDELGGTYTLSPSLTQTDSTARTLTLNGNGIIELFDEGGASLGTSTYSILADNRIAFKDDKGLYHECEIYEGTNMNDCTPKVGLNLLNGRGEYQAFATYLKNREIILPVLDSTDEYRFVGWYTDEDLTNKVTTETVSFTEEENTLYAKYEEAVTVSFDNDGTVTTKTYFQNDTVSADDIPELIKDDNRFDGWYTKDADGNWGSKVTSSTVITESVTFYAKFSHIVTFRWMNGETEVPRTLTKNYYVGDSINVWSDRNGLTDETKAKKFVAWYTADGTDGNWGDELKASTVLVSEEITFYAKWNDQAIVHIYDGTEEVATLVGADHSCYIGDNTSSSIYNYKPEYDAAAKKWVGIYVDSSFETALTYSYKLEAENTFYVKYYYAATVQFINGEEVVSEVTGKFENDKLSSSDIPVELTENVPEGKVFGGWYLVSDGIITDEEVSTSKELGLVNVYKAKFIDPSPLEGDYDGFEAYGTTYRKWVAYTTIAANGDISGVKSGKITKYDAETGTFVLVAGSSEYFGYYDAEAKAFAFNGSAGVANGLGTDTYVLLSATKDMGNVESSLYKLYDNNKTRIVTITFGSESITSVIRNDKLYANVTVTATDIAGNEVALADAKIITVTRNGNELTKFSVDGTTTSDNIPTTDGYEGSYTLEGDADAYVLDGKGSYTHGADIGTYAVNGMLIALSNGCTYGIDVDNKTLSTVSAFAGYIFTGTYYDEWDESNTSISITFAMTSDISGTFTRGTYLPDEMEFTATLDGNTITITFTTDSNSHDFIGKTVTGTISGGTITFTSCTAATSNGLFSFANNGSVTCSGFSL